MPVRLAQNGPLVVVLLLLIDSLHFIFARLLLPHLPPVASSLYVLGVATLELGLFLGMRRQINMRFFFRHVRFFLTIGVLVAAATALSYMAVAYIDPGTASLLSQTSTLFALGFGLFWLRERLSWGELGGALVAVIGVLVISFQPGDLLQLGSILVLTSALSYAMHAAVVKRYGSRIEFGNFFLFRVASITVF